MRFASSTRAHFLRTCVRLCAILPGLWLGTAVHAQGNARLYDPEPPVDSGYVRIVLASPSAPVDLWVDGQPRISNLAAQQLSEYLVLIEGAHTLELHAAGKSAPTLTHALTVARGKSLTLAFAALRADATPLRFEDKGNTNKLKVLLSAYHLAPKAGALDITTADGITQVFSNLAYAQSVSLQVNPITVELQAHTPSSKAVLARTTLEMTQGGTYSIILTAAKDGKLQATGVLSKTERLNGK